MSRGAPRAMHELADIHVMRFGQDVAIGDDEIEILPSPSDPAVGGEGKQWRLDKVGPIQKWVDWNPLRSLLNQTGVDSVGKKGQLVAMGDQVASKLQVDAPLPIAADGVMADKQYAHAPSVS